MHSIDEMVSHISGAQYCLAKSNKQKDRGAPRFYWLLGFKAHGLTHSSPQKTRQASSHPRPTSPKPALPWRHLPGNEPLDLDPQLPGQSAVAAGGIRALRPWVGFSGSLVSSGSTSVGLNFFGVVSFDFLFAGRGGVELDLFLCFACWLGCQVCIWFVACCFWHACCVIAELFMCPCLLFWSGVFVRLSVYTLQI